MPVQFTCPRCGTAFFRAPSHAAVALYCSRACRYVPRAAILSDDGLTARIPLLARDRSVRDYVVVDAVLAEWAAQWNWHMTSGYACRTDYSTGKATPVWLHREIVGLSKDDPLDVDHENRNRLDCRRSNLRATTHGQNSQDLPAHPDATSRHRGVDFHRVSGKWRARIGIAGKVISLGMYDSEEQAAAVALEGRRRHMPYAVD